MAHVTPPNPAAGPSRTRSRRPGKMLTRRFRLDQISHRGRDRIRSQVLGKSLGSRDRTRRDALGLWSAPMSAFLANHTRTHSCGELRAADAGKHVVLTGWVQTYR